MRDRKTRSPPTLRRFSEDQLAYHLPTEVQGTEGRAALRAGLTKGYA